ncbi:MAG: Hsp20 family protein [Alphaproteobacteria bacterium]|nr:Hsp20 family protein [Alphaproteobacteria bacterium]
MRHIDFAPLYRSTVGFDRLVNMLDHVAGDENGFPPYNIERLSENEYRISMAVAGFSPDELDVEVKEQSLSVRGEKSTDTQQREFLHRGIATRTFERRFQLADHVEVKDASYADGLLNIGLVREVPERMKPRSISITASPSTPAIEARTVDAQSARAQPADSASDKAGA